jgi:hypothetical protein
MYSNCNYLNFTGADIKFDLTGGLDMEVVEGDHQPNSMSRTAERMNRLWWV